MKASFDAPSGRRQGAVIRHQAADSRLWMERCVVYSCDYITIKMEMEMETISFAASFELRAGIIFMNSAWLSKWQSRRNQKRAAGRAARRKGVNYSFWARPPEQQKRARQNTATLKQLRQWERRQHENAKWNENRFILIRAATFCAETANCTAMGRWGGRHEGRLEIDDN